MDSVVFGNNSSGSCMGSYCETEGRKKQVNKLKMGNIGYAKFHIRAIRIYTTILILILLYMIMDILGYKPINFNSSSYLIATGIIMFSCRIVIQKRSKQFISQTIDSCHVGGFLYEVKKLEVWSNKGLNLAKKWWGRWSNLNASLAYSYLGDLEQMKSRLTLLENMNVKKNKIHHVIYLSRWVSYYMAVFDFDKANDILFDMERLLATKKYSKEVYDHMDRFIKREKAVMEFEQGNGEAFKCINDLYEISPTLLAKVTIKFHLGRIHLHESRFDEAKEAFEYVIRHGGDTYYVNEAKEFLSFHRDNW